MLNAGKESYNRIAIPDDKLLAAIGEGLHREKMQWKKQVFQSLVTAAAACVFILFGCANIPTFYTYAREIPIIKEFVQAMRIGHGGKAQGNVTPAVSSDSKSVTLSFTADGEVTDEVLSYSISYHYAPARVQIVFHGTDDGFYNLLKEKLDGVDAVSSEEELDSLLLKYQEEAPVQVRNKTGEYLLVIEGYESQAEAEQGYEVIVKKYGTDHPFYVSSGKIEDVPK